jgi:putative flippase GtrA
VIKNLLKNQVFLFLMVGGFAASCNFFSRIIFNQWFSYSTSIVLAYLIGMLTAFILNKFIVFKYSTQSFNKSVLYFSLINLLAIFQTCLLSITLNSYLFPTLGIFQYSKEIAHAIGVLLPVFSSYYGHKKLSFSSH